MTSPEALAAEVEPRCRHFAACGGCQMQHLSQATQVRWKSEALRSELLKAGVAAPEARMHTAEEYAYRNRIRLRLEAGQVGYSRRASHEFLPVTECPIAAPLLWRAAEQMEQAGAETPWPTACREVELVASGDESALQMLLHVDSTVATLDRDAPRQFRSFAEAIRTRVPELAGAGLLVQGELTAGSRRVQERQRVEVARWGAPSLRYRVNGAEYTVSRGAFFQVNLFLTGRMVELVVGGRSGQQAWDLFAGAGLFSVALASRFQQVTAVEVGQPAAADLAAALGAVRPQHRAIAEPVLTFLQRQKTGAPDLVVMDPPRAGLGRPVTDELRRIQAAELVYVSCDRTTFARDARALLDSRYTITELHLLDLFPQTTHTETIAVFRRG